MRVYGLYVVLMNCCLFWMCTIGFIDDSLKLHHRMRIEWMDHFPISRFADVTALIGAFTCVKVRWNLELNRWWYDRHRRAQNPFAWSIAFRLSVCLMCLPIGDGCFRTSMNFLIDSMTPVAVCLSASWGDGWNSNEVERGDESRGGKSRGM